MSTGTNRIVFLGGERVNLRPIMEEDLPAFHRWINDPNVRHFLASYMPITMPEEKEWFEGIGKQKPNSITLAIETVEGELIGNMGLYRIDFISGTAWTGAMIGNPEYWGKGYGTEAKMLLLDYAFNTLGLRKICSAVFEFNGRSHAYLLKTGYLEEGRLKAQRYRDGQYWDEILMAVFRDDWLRLSEEHKPR